MKRKIHNLELNEVPLSVVQYILDHQPKSKLSKLFHQGRLHLFQTIATDVEESRLYPSQSWASYLTSKPLDEHKCYWYSDPISVSDLLYSRLVDQGVDIGIVGSLHSSKIETESFDLESYKYLIPDCFSPSYLTKPSRYSNFQQLNTLMVSRSARVTNSRSLLMTSLRHSLAVCKSPSSYGLSLFSVKQIFRILFRTLVSSNKEYLRVLQFPLLASIYIDQWKKNAPSYASIFTNHLAGNMHRYFYAFTPSAFPKSGMYSEKWILANRFMIPESMRVFDDFLSTLMKVTDQHQTASTFVISGSMGQHANQDLDTSKKFAALITNLERFLTSFMSSSFAEGLPECVIQISSKGANMAPQYGFDFTDPQLSSEEKENVVKGLAKYLKSLGMRSHFDINGSSLVVSANILDPTKAFTAEQHKKLTASGISISPIHDHHSGRHCPEGIVLLIDPSEELLASFNAEVNPDGFIDYLKVGTLIERYLTNREAT